MVRGLLTSPGTDPPVAPDPSKVPLVELLSRHLAAYRKHDAKEHVRGVSVLYRWCSYSQCYDIIQQRELFENILTALSQLAIADTQSLSTLVDSITLIPSLVSFTYQVTSGLWSELELFENSSRNHKNWRVARLDVGRSLY